MKLVKSSSWYRLRGQIGPNDERCKLDTPVFDKERVFFIPESDDEVEFFYIDTTMSITGIPYGPSNVDNVGDETLWGWRFFPDRTEEDMDKFAKSVASYMKTIHEKGVATTTNDTKKPVLN